MGPGRRKTGREGTEGVPATTRGLKRALGPNVVQVNPTVRSESKFSNPRWADQMHHFKQEENNGTTLFHVVRVVSLVSLG